MLGWLGTRGRIRRRVWWLAYALPVLAGLLALVVPNLMIEYRTGQERSLYRGAEWYLLFGLGWIATAGAIRRLHDRGRSGWLVLLAWVVLLLPWTGWMLFWEAARLHGQQAGAGMPIMVVIVVLLLVFALACLWMVVELGFLRGTPGPNAYGPDPRGGRDAAPPAPVSPAPPPMPWTAAQQRAWGPPDGAAAPGPWHGAPKPTTEPSHLSSPWNTPR
ncbi:MAG TPA: DUF805 domain-containing protein [Acetobacteraceae bacterium]|nr:DUF805 domain-containing protein [Acetobacteraceae bacterium]